MTTPSPFRSTIAFASRRPTRPVVERSVFVIATADTRRVAIPVESVERVVRVAYAEHTVAFEGRQLPVRDLARLLGVEDDVEHEAGPASRLLIVRPHDLADSWFAVRVSTVHEVYAVETALVLPATADSDHSPLPPAIRGEFTRHEQRVWVLDLSRLPEQS